MILTFLMIDDWKWLKYFPGETSPWSSKFDSFINYVNYMDKTLSLYAPL